MPVCSGTQDDQAEVITALESIWYVLAMRAAYEDLLETTIFPFPRDAIDKKQICTFQGILKPIDALQILSLVWKESDLVTEAALAQAGVTKAYCGQPLNSHMIGADVSDTPKDVAKNVSWVRSVTLAAAAYGLIERVVINKTKVEIRGTARLHAFMKELGAQVPAKPLLPVGEQITSTTLSISE